MKKLTILILKIYRYTFSGVLRLLFGKGCRFTPTCSEYGIEVIEKFGLIKGSYLTTRRILSCHP